MKISEVTLYALKRTRFDKGNPSSPDHVYLDPHNNPGPLSSALMYPNYKHAEMYASAFDKTIGLEVKKIKITMEEIE